MFSVISAQSAAFSIKREMFSNTISPSTTPVTEKDNNNGKESPYYSEFNFKFANIPETLGPPFKPIFTGHKNGLIKCDPGGLVIVPRYEVHAEKIYRIQPRKDDVWQITFPKTGFIPQSITSQIN